MILIKLNMDMSICTTFGITWWFIDKAMDGALTQSLKTVSRAVELYNILEHHSESVTYGKQMIPPD